MGVKMNANKAREGNNFKEIKGREWKIGTYTLLFLCAINFHNCISCITKAQV